MHQSLCDSSFDDFFIIPRSALQQIRPCAARSWLWGLCAVVLCHRSLRLVVHCSQRHHPHMCGVLHAEELPRVVIVRCGQNTASPSKSAHTKVGGDTIVMSCPSYMSGNELCLRLLKHVSRSLSGSLIRCWAPNQLPVVISKSQVCTSPASARCGLANQA
jgi:hypothetical protein